MTDNRLDDFRWVERPADYIREQALVPRPYIKRTSVAARPGVPGERVVTLLPDGFRETENIVKTDPHTGAPDWVVTGSAGERYIVTDAAFREKYRPDPDAPGRYNPMGKPVLAAQIREDLRIRAPWGEIEAIRSGGWLVIAGEDDIYGVSEADFKASYAPLDPHER